ncbi:MAG: hypothetical protein GVY36_19730 [Verrucomicrobia bacterium]|jgi:hypothetical protein|nr:hypothetical protein [Verrucomicrobiota bacterium]
MKLKHIPLLLISPIIFGAQLPEIRIEKDNNGLPEIVWQSEENCIYDLDASTTLQTGDWAGNAASRVGTGGEIRIPMGQIVGAPSPEKAFVRLRVTDGTGGAVGSDFVNFDSDGDGIPDEWELLVGLNPNDPDDAGDSVDADGDGVNALDEFLAGTDPFANDQEEGGGTGGGGGGETFSGVLPLPTNQEVVTVVGDGDEDVAVDETGTFSFAVNSSSFFVVVAVYTDEYPTYTGDGSEFNDTVEYTVTPSEGTAVNDSLDVNSIHGALSSDGKDFDLGDGERFYSFEQDVVFENASREAFTINYDLSATNIGDGSLPSGVTVAAFPVQIVPTSASAGTLGDLILSNQGKSGEKHFVSTKQNSSLNTEFIEFEVTGISEEIFTEFLEWEGGEAGDTALKRKVSRASASKTELKVKVKSSGDVVDKLNVWLVWATISGSVTGPNTEPITGNSGSVSVQLGDRVFANYVGTATITPNSIFNTSADVPNMTGQNHSPAPAGTDSAGRSVTNGAFAKWDMSRRISRTLTINADPKLNTNVRDRDISFPSDPLVGNDDSFPFPANNNPYNTNGVLGGADEPSRGFAVQGGVVGSTYENDTSFEEFARVEINGKWYLLLEGDPWGVKFKFKKVAITEAEWGSDTSGDGDTNDNVMESHSAVDRDFNGDGDKDDVFGSWRNDNSTISN